MGKNAKYALAVTQLSVFQFALVALGYVFVNVGVALVGLSVGSEFHRGKPSVGMSPTSETSRNYTVHFTVSSELSRDIHLVVKPVLADGQRESSFRLSYSFIGIGPDSSVSPILRSSGRLKLDSCAQTNTSCVIVTSSSDEATNASAIVSMSHHADSSPFLDEQVLLSLLRPTSVTATADGRQIFVVDVHNSRISNDIFATRSLTLLFELTIDGSERIEFEYLTVRPQFVSSLLVARVVVCALATAATILFSRRMKIFYWTDWLTTHKVLCVVLLLIVCENGPFLLLSLMSHSWVLFDWLSVCLRCCSLLSFLFLWYFVLEPKSAAEEQTKLMRGLTVVIAVAPLAAFLAFFSLYPPAVYMSDFTRDMFRLSFSYPLVLFFGILVLLLYLSRIAMMIYSGCRHRNKNHYCYLVALFAVNCVFWFYAVSCLGLRLLSTDFLPPTAPRPSVGNFLALSLRTSSALLLAFFYFPRLRPRQSTDQLTLTFDAAFDHFDNDEQTLFQQTDS